MSTTVSPMSIGASLREAVERLAAAGCDTPRLDAELLLADALGRDRAYLLTHASEALDADAAGAFAERLERRAAREPVAYILGSKPFRHVELAVDRRVLIPRDATEALVELAVRELPRGARAVDVGTGSGAIAAALACERPDLRVLATERSPDALALARANLERLAPRVELLAGDLLAPLAEPVDAVLANLPYVPDGAPLQPEIARYEPAEALFAGPDGLDAYRALLADVVRLRPSWIALEMGDGQGPALSALVRDAGFPDVRVEPELGGAPRVVVGTC